MKNIFLKSFGFIVFLSLSFALSGCDKIVDPTGLAPGEMSATSSVEGSFFAKDAVADSTSSYLVNASMPSSIVGENIIITFQIPKSTAPYTVTIESGAIAFIDYCLEKTVGSCTTFRATKGNGIGTITITSLSPYLEGTFSGTLPQIGGAGSRKITGGEFKANYK